MVYRQPLTLAEPALANRLWPGGLALWRDLVKAEVALDGVLVAPSLMAVVFVVVVFAVDAVRLTSGVRVGCSLADTVLR